jgi:hypothetical protein
MKFYKHSDHKCNYIACITFQFNNQKRGEDAALYEYVRKKERMQTVWDDQIKLSVIKNSTSTFYTILFIC